jgi:methionine salvage enolase-phosphatase E1
MQQIKLFLVTRYNIYESGSSSKVIAISNEDANVLNNLEQCFECCFDNLDEYERISYKQIFIENIGADASCYHFVEDKINEFFKPFKNK